MANLDVSRRRLQGRSGEVSGPEERIGLWDGLRSYTTTPAWQDHADRWKGSLRRGMTADLCVLDGRLAIDPHEISDLPVSMTIVDGEIASDASGSPAGRLRRCAKSGRRTSAPTAETRTGDVT